MRKVQNSPLVHKTTKTDPLHIQDPDSFNVIMKEELEPAYRQHLHSHRSETGFHQTIGCDVKYIPSLFQSQAMHVFLRVTLRQFY